MKEKNMKGSFGLRNGIAAGIAILLIATSLILLVKAETNPCPIIGYVYDEDGNPLEGVVVRIRDLNTGAWGENTTDGGGMFNITLGGGQGAPPWVEWYYNDTLLGVATYGGREGRSVRTINYDELGNGYLWLNITLGTPKTTKTIGNPNFIKYDYDDGDQNYGYLVSEEINVSADVAYLSFWTWWQIEGNEPSSHDLMNVYISTDGGYNRELLKTLNPVDDPGEPYLYYGSNGFNTTPVWVFENIDISAYVPNEIVIIFEFDTENEISNYWEGWYIDDIQITEFGGNIPFRDDVENGVGNWTYTGYWHISEHRNHSSSHAWYYGIEKSYVTSDTSFKLKAEGYYQSILYRIWYNDSWTNWTEYEDPFNLPEECMHYIEFYAENGTNSEPVNNQTHYVDNSAPLSNYGFGEPNATLNYGGYNYTAIKKCTPMIINAYDMPEDCGAGVEWLNYSIWWNESIPNNYKLIKEVSIHDNDANDTDKRVGFITAELHFEEECFHEIKWRMVDYLGHASPQHSVDIAVDATPPTINKTIGEPKYIDANNWTWVSCKTPIWFNITDSGCGGGVGVWMFGINVYWNETRVPEGGQQLFELIKEIVVEDNEAIIKMTVYNETNNVTINLTLDTTNYHDILTNPNGTIWIDEGNHSYEIIDWEDDGNGILDECDNITFDILIAHVEKVEVELVDLNEEFGEISYLFKFDRNCFHEPEIWAIDYVGNEYKFKEKDMVDCTPPTIRKDIEKVIALEQNEFDTYSYTNISDYQSFKAPWSYIDAISVYVNGTFNSTYPIYIEIYDDDNGEPGNLLNTSEKKYLSGNYTGWLQLHLLDRLYVEHNETYWIGLIYDGAPIKWEAKSNYPNSGPYPDGFAIVDNEVNSSWDFTFRIEYYAMYPYDYLNLNYTYLTSEAILDLSSLDEGCMGGVGLNTLLYRIWYNKEWHPNAINDYYCGNINITKIDEEYWYVAINETVKFTRISFHEECTHYLEIRAEDLVGNVRIVNQTHYVDNSPPKLKIEYPDEHGFYYDEQNEKQFVRACNEFYLNLTDEPECGVGWRDFTFYFRYEYTNFTTPYIEKHPIDENDTTYGEVVNISGELWWKIISGTPSITLHFCEECYHKIYYFYEATDWLDNSINESGIEEIYVDEFEPEVSKEHPWCYKEEQIYVHDIGGGKFEELYPNYGNIYEWMYEFHGPDGKPYLVMYDEKYGVNRSYLVENMTLTLNLSDNEEIYIEFIGYSNESLPWPSSPEDIYQNLVGSLWKELHPKYNVIYNVTNSSVGKIWLMNMQTGIVKEWNYEELPDEWNDYKLKPVPFIQACSKIELEAKDMPDMLELIDQFHTKGDETDTLQKETVNTPFPWDAQTFMPNYSYINATYLYLKWFGDATVTVYIHDKSFNVIGTATANLTGIGEDWVKFEFNPGLDVIPNRTYYIEAYGDPASYVSWYFANPNMSIYPRGHAWISGEKKEEIDWRFQIVAYRPNPCASGIEGIYYGYEDGGEHHPINETDAPHGETIVNITKYYDWDEINGSFYGYWLWYLYDENVGVHFYEECTHWLYYWAKDNVCHHTDVHIQVYHVDKFKPEVIKEHPEHGYYTPVEIRVNEIFENETDWLEGTFHVRDEWNWSFNDGWKPNPYGQYIDKIQYIPFYIINNDTTHDLILHLHVEEIVGDAGITLENGSDVNNKIYTINVPAGSTYVFNVTVYDNLEFLRWGVWRWWAEVENATQYLRAGARINLSAYDPGECPSGIEAIYYRYEWNGTNYPAEGHPAARNGSEIEPYVPEIANYWWFVYDDRVGIVFKEECEHDLYYFAKDRACHNSTLHHQIYYIDASSPVVEEILPEHGAIGNTTTSLHEDFEEPFGNGWAVVDNGESSWNIRSEDPPSFFYDNIPHSGKYAALAWKQGTADAWLITPKITIPEDGNLTFWYKVYRYGSAGFKVGVNNRSGQEDTSAFVEVWNSGTFSDTIYRYVEIDLSKYAGQEVYIGFHCYYLSHNYNWPFAGNGLIIDDVWIGSIHRIETLIDDDVEKGYSWSIDDLTVTQTSYWQTVRRLPVTAPHTTNVEWSENLTTKPALWCGDLSLGNVPNGGGKYACNWNDTLTIKNPINLSNATGIVNLSFDIWQYLGTGDYLYIEASNDSINWTNLETISGSNNWTTKTINISQYIGNATLWVRFRFVSDDTYDSYQNGVFIDNLTIRNETIIYFFDYFNTLGNWNALMLETSKWHVTTYDYHSYNHSWYCGVEPQYLNCMNDALISQEIDLTGYAGKKAMFIFWHRYDMSNDGDRAYVEIYADGTWNTVAYYNGQRDWVQEFIDISNYIGKVIKIRFRFYSNNYIKDLGWLIDDIKLEIREVEDAVFEDNFDMYKYTVTSTAIPRFPPTDGLSEYGDWSIDGLHAGNSSYGWEEYVGAIYSVALVHGCEGQQEEYLYSPVIYDLPKFSNLTFNHYFKHTYATGYVYLIDESETPHLLKIFRSNTYYFESEDISLWDYYGQDIQIVFLFTTPSNYSSYNEDFWAIEWVDITSHGFLRACAPIIINAYDMPENECAVGISAIYWRYEFGGEENLGYGDEEVCGCEIPGITEEDEEIYDYDWWAIYDNGEYDNNPAVGVISFEIHLPENCTHDIYYFAKDKLCHGSELKHERWYVDGRPPETLFGISWGDHPWIPKNDEIIKVAIYNSSIYGAGSYFSGFESNNYDEFYDVLASDARFDVDVITKLDYNTLIYYDVLILPDNGVPDDWLDDVDAWFKEGKRIIAGDSSICFIAYSGYLWADAAGTNGEDVYWDYGSLSNDQKIALEHPITFGYTVGQVISGINGDAQMYINKLPVDAVILTISNTYSSNAYVVYREVPGKGSIVVLGPYETIYGNEYDLIINACSWDIYYKPRDTYYKPGDTKPEVICINDDVHFYANHGSEACVYPYNWQNATYYRWAWYNESSEEWEFYPTPDMPGAINGSSIVVSSHEDKIQYNDSYSFWLGQEPPFGGWIYWMRYTEPFYLTEGCEHILYYFSKDDLCNTEKPVEWHVGVDDESPESKLDFEITNGLLYYNETSNVYYFQNCTWIVINTTDLPSNPDCQSGIWYVNYTVWRLVSKETTIQLISNQIKKGSIYISGNIAGNITDYIDSNGDGLWNYCDYMDIEWLPPYNGIHADGWYHVESISGYYNVKIREVMGASGEWQTLIPWTEAYEWEDGYIAPGIKYDKYYEYDEFYGKQREYFRIWLHLGDLVNFSCGKYEIHWQVYDYNNMTEGEKKQDIVIDCTPPRTNKEFEEPYIEEIIAGGELIHWVTPYTKIWLNASEEFVWDSGVNEIWYQFWNEEPILLWKLGDENHSKHWFTVEEAIRIILNDPNATVEDYFNARPTLNKTIIELYHWAVDNVGHVEDKQKSKQHIYIDYMPPTSRVDEIIPYERDEIPFDITVVDIVDHGSEVSGPVGVCKVEVYYSYSEDNISWDEWQLYITLNIPYEQRLNVPNQTFSFTAPEGGGYYRFISIAYDCLGNKEEPPYWHGTYDAECLVLFDREPPEITKEYGQPCIEIELDGEIAHAITSDTPIYLNATDMPEEDYNGLDKIYWSFDGSYWYESPSFNGARYGSISFTPEQFGLVEGVVYHLFFKASDMRGYVSEEGKQKFIIDNTPPTTTITIGNNETMPFDVTINASDEIAGVKTIKLYFRYSSDGSTWTDWIEYGSYDGNYTWSFIYKPSEFCYYKPGYYEFYAYAEDNLGNAKGLPIAEASCYVPPIEEDFNGDGRVNVLDLYFIISNWFKDPSSPDWDEVKKYDLDGSERIDAGDIYILILKWTG